MMEMLSSPSNGTRATDRAPGGPQRAFSLPIKLADTARSKDSAGSQPGSGGVEILFCHDSAKVVAFSPPAQTSQVGSSPLRRPDELGREPIGNLPWSSKTENIISAGRLQLYRAHSVAFLSAGQIVHPILAKSQCWCVDGESKFVLRIRGNAYYRIELPNFNQIDKRKAEDLSGVFATILLYEKTPCPFTRNFTVDLPESPKIAVRKRPWKPPERSERARDPKSQVSEASDEHAAPLQDQGDKGTPGERLARNNDYKEVISGSPRLGLTRSELLGTPTRPKVLSAARSITVPLQLPLRSTASTGTSSFEDLDEASSLGSSRIPSSVNSFHTVQSRPSTPEPPAQNSKAIPGSSPSPRNDYPLPTIHSPQLKHEASQASIAPSPSRVWDLNVTPSESEDDCGSTTVPPTTPGLMSDVDDHNEEEPSEIDTPSSLPLKPDGRTTSAPSALTPRSSHSCLSFPPASPGHRLATAIVQTTCSLMFATPAQLFNMMLCIARRVVSGMLRGVVIGIGEGGERIPCEWDSSDSDGDMEDDWNEDDYGAKLSRLNSHGLRKRDPGGSWELD